MNTVKTFFLLMVMSGLLLVVGGAVGGEVGIIFALIFAIVMNFGAYWFSDRIALKMAHAHPITERDDPELYSIVAEQASNAGLPMPSVFEIDSDSPNAFATGRSPKKATVAVTTGIRRILNREELAGVLAHEMAHVGNRDTLIMAVVATIAGAISMLAMIAQFSMIFGGMGGGRDRGGNIIGLLVVAIVMPLAAGLVRAAISR
ncbi:MAG: protease HtpX, partial [SAR202 cluster bacterium Io17-Chloro-G9]